MKICGLRSLQDITAADGADLVGFIVGETRSRRNLPLAVAARLRREVSGPKVVAVTTRTEAPFLEGVVRLFEPDALQVHGVRTEATAASIRELVDGRAQLAFAFHPETTPDFFRISSLADLVFLDGPGELGGRGKTHDWAAATEAARTVGVPAFLSGGLTPENVEEAVRRVRPYGVDVSSGVEGPEGKDADKVREFLRRART